MSVLVLEQAALTVSPAVAQCQDLLLYFWSHLLQRHGAEQALLFVPKT